MGKTQKVAKAILAGKDNLQIKKDHGFKWWQVNDLREQLAARSEWREARRWFSGLPDRQDLYVWGFDETSSLRVARLSGETTDDYYGLKRTYTSISKSQVMDLARQLDPDFFRRLRISTDLFCDQDHHAIDAIGKTEKPRYDGGWDKKEKPNETNNYGAHVPYSGKTIAS